MQQELCDDNKIIEYFQNRDINQVRELFSQFDSRNIEHLCVTCLKERVKAYSDSMTYSDMSTQVNSYASFKEKDIVVSLLSVLLEFPSTMKRSVQTVIELLKHGDLNGKCALRCLGQIHAVMYKMRFDEDSLLDFKQILAQISADVISLVKNWDVETDCTNGIISALELLPPIINATQYIEQREIERGEDVEIDLISSENIIADLLDIERWHSKFFLVLLNVFVDVSLNEDQTQQLVDKVKRDVNSIDSNDYMGLVKLLLQLSDKYQKAEYLYVVRELFGLMTSDMKMNICFAIDMELRNSHSLLKLLLTSLKVFYTSRNNILALSFSQHLCDFVIILLSFNHEMFKDEVLQMLVHFIGQMSKHDEELSKRPIENLNFMTTTATHVGSSSSSTVQADSINRSYIEILCFAACKIDNVSEILLTACGDWSSKQKALLRNLGEAVMVQLFGQCPTTRETILSISFNVIAEEPKLVQKQLYLRVLREIVARYPLVLVQEFVPRIKEWLSYLPSFSDLDISMSLLSCFIKLTRNAVAQDFQNFIYMMLKKLLPTRNSDNRQLAIYGLTILFSETAGNELRQDIISTLRLAFSFNEERLKQSLYRYLADMLESTKMDADCVQLLYRLLADRVKKYLIFKDDKWELDMIGCFEDNGIEKDPNICLREPLTDLFKCYFTLHLQTKDNPRYKEIRTIFHHLSIQFVTDINKLSMLLGLSAKDSTDKNTSKAKQKLTLIQSAIVTRRCKDSDITPSMRMTIVVPIFELMIVSVLSVFFRSSNPIQHFMYHGHFGSKEFGRSKCLRALEAYALVTRLSLVYPRWKNKATTGIPLFGIDICFVLIKELCDELETIIPKLRSSTDDQTVKVPPHISLTSLEQLLDVISLYAEQPQNHDSMHNSFMDVALLISKNVTLLDLIDEDVEHSLSEKQQLCIKFIIIIRYIFAVYQETHPWKNGSLPKKTVICSTGLTNVMKDYMEESRYDKLMQRMSTKVSVSSFRTKTIQLFYTLFCKCQFTEDEESISAVSSLLLYMFGEDLVNELVSSRSRKSKEQAKPQNLYSFKDLTVYFSMQLDKEVNLGCSFKHFSICLKVMTAMASIYPPNKALSSSSSLMPLVNHVTTKRSQTLHKACKILEKILIQYVITHSTLIKGVITFMLSFSQTERAIERCNQIITTCSEKYHGRSTKNDMNICEKEKCTVEAIQCILRYFETLLVSNQEDPDESSDSKLKQIEDGSPDKSMENIEHIVKSLDKIIEMVFEDEVTRPIFQKTKKFTSLEKRIENLLSKLCRFTINHCRALRVELTRAVKEAVSTKEDTCISSRIKLLSCRAENYYSICKLFSRMQYYKGSILTSDEKELFSAKYATLITSCEKLTVEIRNLYNRYTTIQSSFPNIMSVPLLEKLATTEIELLIQDSLSDEEDKGSETEESTTEDEEYTQKSKRKKNKLKDSLQKQKKVLQKRKRILEDQLRSGERVQKKLKTTSRKRQSRSRNAYIDYALYADGEHDDNYVDLEDFIDADDWEAK